MLVWIRRTVHCSRLGASNAAIDGYELLEAVDAVEHEPLVSAMQRAGLENRLVGVVEPHELHAEPGGVDGALAGVRFAARPAQRTRRRLERRAAMNEVRDDAHAKRHAAEQQLIQPVRHARMLMSRAGADKRTRKLSYAPSRGVT